MAKYRFTVKSVAAALALCAGVSLVGCAAADDAAVKTAPSKGPVYQISKAAAASGARYDSDADIFQPKRGVNGMVVSEQAYATQAGVDIMKKGGNAIDAAVAVGFTLAVALPNAGNIGGGGFMVVRSAKTGETVALDFREKAPGASTRDMYVDEKGELIEDKSLHTRYAVGVPGTVAGLTRALERWGTMPLSEVMAPAIRLAEQGFPVSDQLASDLNTEKEVLSRTPATKAIFFKGDRPLKAGELLVQRDLANSLKLIAKQGSKAFYEGEIGKKIIEDMKKHGGPMTMQDLKDYKAVERAPVKGTYRGYDILTMPTPSSGGLHVVQILNILERYPLAEWGHNSAKTIQHYAEAMKRAYADRSEYLGDSDFVKVPSKAIASKKYADEIAKGIKDGEVTPSVNIKPGNVQPYESDQTTHYSVMDKAGNAVGVTYTLNLNFGSGIVAEGTGILLNDQMDDFSAKPGVANAYGLIGGEANAIAPGKRPLSSMTPTIVMKDGKPFMVTGSPGGARIISTVLQSIVNSIDFKMNAAEAVVAPRVHHQWLPDELRLERGVSPDTISILGKEGYDVKVMAPMGRVQMIQSDGKGNLFGYSDPRNPDGAALGF